MFKRILLSLVVLSVFGFAAEQAQKVGNIGEKIYFDEANKPFVRRYVNLDPKSTNWIQISIYPPACFPNNAANVTGFRFNLGYAEHLTVRGLDVGLVNDTVDEMYGIQAGIFNRSYRARSSGAVLGIVNEANEQKGLQVAALWNKNENTSGVQASPFYNNARDFHGVQFAIANNATKVKGWQIGLVNVTDDLTGVQFGLLNFGKGRWYVPFINW